MASFEKGLFVGIGALIGAFGVDYLMSLHIHDPYFPYQPKKLIADLVIGVIGFGAGAALTRR